MRKGLLTVVLTALVTIAAVVLAARIGWSRLNEPLTLPEDGIFLEVAVGSSLSRVTGDLADLGILRHPRIVNWYAGWQGISTSIHAGEYRLQAPLTAPELLDTLVRGDVYLHQFTIVEGWRFAEMLGRLREHSAISVTDLDTEAIMVRLDRAGEHPEGQFLPDTYSFPRGMTDVDLLALAHDALWSLLEEGFRNRSDGSVLQSAYEGLILASIIEKETALDSERPLMAGVFNERIRRGMRLQADPTVIYGLGDAYDGDITRAQLNADTPYNTYTRAGLPPTPIALAGRASIDAAFDPVDSGALYFVATGDADGSHVFSATLEEHNAAVNRYLEAVRRQSP
jgi:UPF0755 protein